MMKDRTNKTNFLDKVSSSSNPSQSGFKSTTSSGKPYAGSAKSQAMTDLAMASQFLIPNTNPLVPFPGSKSILASGQSKITPQSELQSQKKVGSTDRLGSGHNHQRSNAEFKPPRNLSKDPKGIAPIDHEKQRQKLQEIMAHLNGSEEDPNLYDSLNLSKKGLLPIHLQKKLAERQKSASKQSTDKRLKDIDRSGLGRGGAGTAVEQSKGDSIRIRKGGLLSIDLQKQTSIKNAKKPGNRKEISSAQSDKRTTIGTNSNQSQKSFKSNTVSSTISKGVEYGSTGLKTETYLGEASKRNDLEQEEEPTPDQSFDAITMNHEQVRAQIEKDMEIKDRFYMMSYGLLFKDRFRRRKYFIEAVTELKEKFKKVLYLWQDRRAERNFKELQDLILNYDQDDASRLINGILGQSSESTQIKLGGKFVSKRLQRLRQEHEQLQTVEEREEELDETTFNQEYEVEKDNQQSSNEEIETIANEESNQQQLDREEEEFQIKMKTQREKLDLERSRLAEFEKKAKEMEIIAQQAKQREQELLKQQLEQQVKEQEDRKIAEDKIKQKSLKEQCLLVAMSEIRDEQIEIFVLRQAIEIRFKVTKVIAFLQMIIKRCQYKRSKSAIVKIQSLIRMALSKKKVQFLRADIKQKQVSKQSQIAQLEAELSKSQSALEAPEEKLYKNKMTKQEAIGFIERAWIIFRNGEDGRKCRAYLKTIPFECRRSYVKYFDLKFRTIRLKTEVDQYNRFS